MCGRFYIDDDITEKILRRIPSLNPSSVRGLFQKGDIHPGDEAPAVVSEGTNLAVRKLRWGLPGFQKNSLVINARAETAGQKSAFRNSLAASRCLLPASGFYEWNPRKDKFFFSNEEGLLFLAGFFDPSGRFVILTGAANDSMLPVHPRMPLFFQPEEIAGYLLDSKKTAAFLRQEMPPLRSEILGQTSFI